jgi:omega-hydroxy-beta-dihydromenaquinone-9 sulfotransferase
VPADFKPNWYPFWSPRFWHGIRAGDYYQLLRRNRFAVHPARFPLALTVGSLSLFNTVWSTAQRLILGQKIEQTKMARPPIFIVGHWRTGTTMLHELLSQDPQFAFPSSYDCFAPNHFLISKRIFAPIVGWLMPHRRPMDDMPVGEEFPQEDEFALCALGAPTPYLRIAFPNHEPTDVDLLNLDQAPPEKTARFRAALEFFFKSLSYHYGGKRLLLKSPPHTGRIRLLSQWFPGAKFIHLSRNPYQVFESTLRLWRSLDQVQGFQIARYSDRQLEDFVFDAHARMYAGYFAQRDEIPPDHLVEVKFEDLLASPEDEVQRIYKRLSLGDFGSAMRSRILEYRELRRGHQSRSKGLDIATMERVRARWSEYFEAFGYESAVPRAIGV